MTSIISAKTALLIELLHGPGYVVGLVGRISVRSKGQVVLTPGCARPGLKELVEDGLVTVETIPAAGERPGPPAMHYTLTARGREVALEQRAGLRALTSETEST